VSRTATDHIDCDWFFNQVEAAKSRILLVDYDGTVAPFHADRQQAKPYPKIPEFLRCIMTSCRTRLIVVSGRAAREVPPLLGLSPAPEIWGTHGIEKIDANGRYEEGNVSERALQTLAEAESQLERDGLGEHIEVKLAAVALHWRGFPASDAFNIKTKAYRILEPLAIPGELLLAEFEAGVELRLVSANKGDALQDLLSKLDPAIPVAYLGDDVTDEKAFQVLNGRGLPVLVGSEYRFTSAQMWLRSPNELLQFLTRWIRACGDNA
jgi:trehalose 6-phosphate phosphatase